LKKILNYIFLVTSLAIVIAPVGLTYAEEKHSKRDVEAISNFHYEHIKCFSFYQIGNHCLGNPKDPKNAEIIKAANLATNKILLRAFELGKSIGLTQNAMQSRISLTTQDMMKLINKSCINFSSLLMRHGEQCKMLVENPDSFFEKNYGGR
jgi:hypothetical protein